MITRTVEQLIDQRDQLLAVLERLVEQIETGFFDHISHEHEASATHAARAAIEQAVRA